MRTKSGCITALRLAAAAMLIIINAQTITCHAQGTAFTYQGRLNDGANPAGGIYDLRFTIYDLAGGGGAVAGPVTNAATGVTNGLFTVTLDFGAGVFDGSDRWLEIAVRTNGDAAFTMLAPRQALTPAPYAMLAGSASRLLGMVAAAQLPATVVTNNGAGAVNLTGTFSGNGAGVSNVNAAALAGLTAPNLWQLGGNDVAAGQFLGSTNSQAVELRVNNLRALRLEPRANDSNFSNLVNVVAGSPNNAIASDAYGSVIAGGGADNYYGNAGSNSIASDLSFLGGGLGNSIQIYAYNAFLGGGESNIIQMDSCYSFLGGGDNNTIGTYAINSFLGGGEFNNLAPGSHYSFLGGGEYNTIQAAGGAFLGGGDGNTIQTNSGLTFLGGGRDNTIGTNAYYSFLGGGQGNAIQPKAWHAVLVGGTGNTIGTNASYSFIGAGSANLIQALVSVVGGGYDNAILTNADYSFLGGGEYNQIHTNAYASFLGGGLFNTIQANARRSFLGGGRVNAILTNASYSFLGGGMNNTNGGSYSVVAGGDFNYAGGTNSFAAGHRAKANFPGDFVWADAQDADFNSTGINQFLVRSGGGVGFNTNNPQSALHVHGTVTATTFAGSGAELTSLNAARLTGTAGNLSATNISFSGSLTGNGAGLTNVNAAQLNGLGAASFWQMGGNAVAAGQFVGSTNFQAVELKVDGQRALRLEPTPNDLNHSNIVNLVGGSPSNSIAAGAIGSVIAGGGAGFLYDVSIDEPYANTISADWCFVGGGYKNSIQGSAHDSVLVGGRGNAIESDSSTAFDGAFSFLGGGAGNLIQKTANSSVLVGGSGNSIQTGASSSVLVGGANNAIQPSANSSVLGGGDGNVIQSSAYYSVLVGGRENAIRINSYSSFLGGGRYNSIQTNADHSILVGGYNNTIQTSADYTVLGGGENNTVQTSADHSVLGGGQYNSIQYVARHAFLGGGSFNLIQSNSLASFLGGGLYNSIQARATNSVLCGGTNNTIQSGARFAFLGGGAKNVVSGAGAVVGGGGFDGSSFSGNTASGASSVVVGGTQNIASGSRSAVGGGHNNTATNNYATVAGGAWNFAGGIGSFAAGQAAKAYHDGAFVWSDSFSPDVVSTNVGSVTMRASGGYRLFSNGAMSSGVYLAANGTSWSTISDRNAKKNFAAVDGEDVLNKLAGIPIQQWNYRWEADDATPNLGPMAQDFKAAFYPGRDDKSITTLEYDGVELAAIQALSRKLNDKDAEIQALKQSVAELKETLTRLTQTAK